MWNFTILSSNATNLESQLRTARIYNVWKCHTEARYFKQCSLRELYLKYHKCGDQREGSGATAPLYRHEDLSSNPQQPWKKPGVATHEPVSCEAETGGLDSLGMLSDSLGPGSVRESICWVRQLQGMYCPLPLASATNTCVTHTQSNSQRHIDTHTRHERNPNLAKHTYRFTLPMSTSASSYALMP